MNYQELNFLLCAYDQKLTNTLAVFTSVKMETETQWNLKSDMTCTVWGNQIPIKGKLWQNALRFLYSLF